MSTQIALSKPREDILVSVCFAETDETADREPALSSLAQRLSARFRYWEILLTVALTGSNDFIVPNIPNVRVIKVVRLTDYYHRREIACSEAIGDVVLMSSFDELDVVDPVSMAEAAWDSGHAIVAQRRRPAGALEPFLKALGRSSGLRVSARVMQSMALPRPLLSIVMGYPDQQLALRFLPNDIGIPVQMWNCDGPKDVLGLGNVPKKLELVHSLLSHSASRVLTMTALMAAIASVGSLVYLICAPIVWMMRENSSSESLVLSLVIGAFTLFLGLALFGLSIGLQRVTDLLSADDRDYVVGETGALELFADLSRELNVQIEDGPDTQNSNDARHSIKVT